MTPKKPSVAALRRELKEAMEENQAEYDKHYAAEKALAAARKRCAESDNKWRAAYKALDAAMRKGK